MSGMVVLTGWPDECHDILLRVAGQVPDELLHRLRTWLAAGEARPLAGSLAFAARAYRLPLTVHDAALLVDLVTGDGGYLPEFALTEPHLTEPDLDCPYEFLPVAPDEVPAGTRVPSSLDGTSAAAPALTELDAAAVVVAGAQPGLHGLWRAWRLPDDDLEWPPPKRVFLVEVAARGGRHLVADRFARVLRAAGEVDPQVEVWAVDEDPPAYQMLARDGAALLWAARPPGQLRTAGFDLAPDPARTLSDGQQRRGMLRFLAAGHLLLTTDALAEDTVRPERGAVVPVDVRTDGSWIWTDAIAYHLREYAIAPDPDLLAHAQAAGYHCPPVDTVTAFRAMVALDQAAEPS